MPLNSQDHLNKLNDPLNSFDSSRRLFIQNNNFEDVNEIPSQGNKIYASDDIKQELFNHSCNKNGIDSQKKSSISTHD